ncbi:MAG: hypothetical protein AAB562_01655 [Patescibacteria group bacterium]
MDRRTVTDEQELAVRRQADEVVRRVLDGSLEFEVISPRMQAIIEGREPTSAAMSGERAKEHSKKRDFAKDRREWFEQWYRTLGFAIAPPLPRVSDREFARRRKLGQSLFYRPSSAGMSYEGFMAAVGQYSHWTVKDEANRVKVGWEPASAGYWFWAEVSEDCPRLRTSWNDLSQATNLLSLEEYVVVWHAHKAETDKVLDRRFWTWLCTRFGQGALRADEFDAGVRVHRWYDPGDLAVPYDGGGGRAVEVV